MTMEEADRRVANGAELLDRLDADVAKLDPGKEEIWDTVIDESRLDLSRDEDCILGQLYGGYEFGVKAMHNFGMRDPVECGFELSYSLYEATAERVEAEYAVLTQAWSRLILARREAA